MNEILTEAEVATLLDCEPSTVLLMAEAILAGNGALITGLMDQNKALRTQLTQQAELVEKCMAAMNANADEVDRLKGRLAALVEPEGEADELLMNLGLNPVQYRTEGGVINHLKVKAAILHPDEYPQHITSKDCWCNPEVAYVDPDTGVTVYVHKEIQ